MGAGDDREDNREIRQAADDPASLHETVDTTSPHVDSAITKSVLPGGASDPPQPAATVDEVKRGGSRAKQPAPPSDVAASKDFGDYELLQEIAAGGMGVVYKARHKELHRTVALKMIRSGDLATQEEADRFHAEAEAAANLDHPNIVSIFDVGQHAGQHYFSMAYVEGQSLADMIRENALPGQTAAEYCRAVADAIHYAHQHQTLHRDIKPSNVLIDETDQPRVTDFGLAKRVGSDSDLTETGQVLGTPNYMPPEQALGDNQGVGPHSDIYSLGATLYALITGRPPFQADTAMATLLQVIEKEPVAPRKLNSAIDPDLNTICLKCLEKEPAKRYTTAGEVAEDLGRYLRQEPIAARPISRPARLWRWCRRNRLVAGLLSAVALTLLAGTLVSSFFAVTASQKAHQATVAEGKAKREESHARDKEQEARVAEERALGLVDQLQEERERLIFENYVANIAVAQGKIRDRIHGASLAILEDTPRHLRHWEWAHLMDLCYEETVCLRGAPGGLHIAMSATPDQQRLVVSAGRKAQVWDLAEARLVRENEGCTAHCLLPDRGELLVARENEVVREELDSGTVIAGWPTREAAVKQLAWCAAENCVFEKLGDGSVRLVDVEDGSTLRSLPSDLGQGRVVSFSRDGTRMLVRSKGSATVWDLAGEKSIFQVDGIFGQSSCSAALSDDGRRVLTGHPDMKTVLWDVDTGQAIHEMENQRAYVRAVAFSPDGRRAVSGGTFGIQYWDLETGELLRELAWHDENIVSLAFAPDPRWILAAGWSRVRIWDMKKQGRVSAFRPGPSEKTSTVCQVALSGDGKTLVCTGWDRAGARVFDLESDTLLWELDRPGDAGRRRTTVRVAVSPDGRWAVTGSGDRNADVWDLTTGELVGTAQAGANVGTIVMHPDSDRFAVGYGGSGVRIWSLPDCEQLAAIKPAGAGMKCLDFSRDGRVLLALSGKSVVAWDIEKNEARASLPYSPCHLQAGGIAWGVLFPDGRRALLPTKPGAMVWDSVTGEVLDHYEAGGGAPSLAVSPDGKRAFLGCWDKTVRVWDVETGREVMSFSPHSGGIVSLDISQDGRVLAAGGCGGALDATVYHALDWRKSPEESQQGKQDLWRARFARPAADADEMLPVLRTDL